MLRERVAEGLAGERLVLRAMQGLAQQRAEAVLRHQLRLLPRRQRHLKADQVESIAEVEKAEREEGLGAPDLRFLAKWSRLY